MRLLNSQVATGILLRCIHDINTGATTHAQHPLSFRNQVGAAAGSQATPRHTSVSGGKPTDPIVWLDGVYNFVRGATSSLAARR